MIFTVKDKILATDSSVWQSKVARILQFYWDEDAMEDLPRRFALLWESIKKTPSLFEYNFLVDYVTYNCLNNEKELTKRFAVYDEDLLVSDFQETPAWDEIRLEQWEDGTGPLFDNLSHLDVVRLLTAQREALEPETTDLHNLPVYLGARLPAYSRYRQERILVTFLAMVLDEYSGRVAMLPEPCEADKAFELKWGVLHARIAEYKSLKKLREEILLNDI